MTTVGRPSNAVFSSNVSAFLMLGASAVLFLAHMTVFGAYVPLTEHELMYWHGQAADTLYGTVLHGVDRLFGPSVFVARSVSMVSGLLTLMLAASLADRWSGDALCGAALGLGLLLFPTVAYGFAQGTPYGLISLCTVLAIYLIVSGNVGRARVLSTGVLCAVLPFLHPVGIGAAGLILVFAAWQWQARPLLLQFIFAGGVVFIVLAVFWPALPDVSVSSSGNQSAQPGWYTALVVPYAMVWVAWIFSVLALLASKPLRGILAAEGVKRSWLMVSGFLILTLGAPLVPLRLDETLNMVFTPLVVVGVVAALPMVMWIRLVMPQLKSIVVWIILPVVMYSCFWVVLGPIDLGGFPYDQLARSTSVFGTQFPR